MNKEKIPLRSENSVSWKTAFAVKIQLLHFENAITRDISFERFLVKWNNKPRKLPAPLS